MDGFRDSRVKYRSFVFIKSELIPIECCRKVKWNCCRLIWWQERCILCTFRMPSHDEHKPSRSILIINLMLNGNKEMKHQTAWIYYYDDRETTHARAHEMPLRDCKKGLPSFQRADSFARKRVKDEAAVFIELRLRVWVIIIRSNDIDYHGISSSTRSLLLLASLQEIRMS